MKALTIGNLAKEAGVPVSTIRFYERRGLVKPDARTQANYRTYSTQSVEKLKFIRAAQVSGFNLKDIREMLALTYSDDAPCAEITALIEHRLSNIRLRLQELQRVSRTLMAALKSCCKSGEDWCNRIERLKGRKACQCENPKCSCSPS